MAGSLSPVGKQTFFDDAGAILSAGFVYTYVAGTSTPVATYTDVDLAVPNANPIELDAAGRCTIFLAPGTSYKYVVKTAAGATVWTQDDIDPVAGSAGELGECFVFGGTSTVPVTRTTYDTGATFDKLHPGTSVFNVDPDDLPGTYILEGMGLVDSGTTLTAALVNLSDGAPDTPLVSITFDSTTGELSQSATITMPAGGSARNFGIKPKVDTGQGFCWGFCLMRTA